MSGILYYLFLICLLNNEYPAEGAADPMSSDRENQSVRIQSKRSIFVMSELYHKE